MNDVNLDIEKAVNKFIEDKVKKNWEENSSALLMSTLGGILRREVPDSSDVIRAGLKNYLIRWPIVRQISFPGVDEKIGLVPLDVVVPEDIKSIFGRNKSPRDTRMLPPYSARDLEEVSFSNAFWKVFFTPIRGKCFINILKAKFFQVGDSPIDSDIGQSFEVLQEDIVDLPPAVGLPERVSATREKIAGWLSRNNLAIDNFVSSPAGPSRQDGYRAECPGAFLEKLAHISPEDQSRILIPLDIILKMMHQR